jgi:hypothetical protein
MKRYVFTRPASLEGLADSPDCELHMKELRRAEPLFNPGDPVPESLFRMASAILAQKAAIRATDTGRPYVECAREMRRRFPCLRFATAPYLPDSQFSAITFTTREDESNDDDAAA